ncbi:unnamed protein product [Lactuca virosa]|nr:unnamed protein product [Lactuca virosa]
MFLAWMECNEHNKEARKLSYVEFPTKFVWKLKDRCWKPREKGFSIGRIHTVSPNVGEAYFLRILLNKVKGPKCFADIRTVNGHVCATFREACYALGLLEDDREYIDAIEEASHSGSGYYLRYLFATMLKSNSLSIPYFVWEKTWQYLSDGILYNQQLRLKAPGLSLDEDQVKNLTLYEIEKILLQNNSSLKDFDGMPYPDHESISSSNNRLITEELDFDRTTLLQEFYQLLGSLTDEQRGVFDDIITNVTAISDCTLCISTCTSLSLKFPRSKSGLKMAQAVEDWYKQMPIITRSYLTAAIVTTIGCSLEIISPYNLYLNPRLVVKQYQIWRLITNFLYFRKMDLDFLFHMFFLARYCKLLEENSFRGKTADFFYMLLFGATVLTTIVLVGGMIPYVSESFAKIIFLSNSLTFMMVYVWSKQNPFIHMSFLGLFTFTAAYLPWVLLGFSVLVGASAWVDLLGMIAGHAYYFLEDVYPKMTGRRPLKTPSFIKTLFADEAVVVARPQEVRFAAPPVEEMRR